VFGQLQSASPSAAPKVGGRAATQEYLARHVVEFLDRLNPHPMPMPLVGIDRWVASDRNVDDATWRGAG